MRPIIVGTNTIGVLMGIFKKKPIALTSTISIAVSLAPENGGALTQIATISVLVYNKDGRPVFIASVDDEFNGQRISWGKAIVARRVCERIIERQDESKWEISDLLTKSMYEPMIFFDNRESACVYIETTADDNAKRLMVPSFVKRVLDGGINAKKT